MVNTQKVDSASPLQEGEFRRINGIAGATEEALHRAGVETFAHLATLTPEEIAAALPKAVGVKERAARLEWSAQAAAFAAQLAGPEQVGGLEEPGERQHYASFMVVLLIDEEGSVRRTTVTHVQGETKESWAGWDAQHITGWLAAQAGIQAQPTSMPNTEMAPSAMVPSAMAPPPAETPPAQIGPAQAALGISAMQLIYPVSKRALTALYEGNPFAAVVDFDIQAIARQLKARGAPQPRSLNCQATAVLRNLSMWSQGYSSDASREIPPGDRGSIEIALPGLPAGSYHLDIAVRVWDEEEGVSWSGFTEGVMVRVLAESEEAAVIG